MAAALYEIDVIEGPLVVLNDDIKSMTCNLRLLDYNMKLAYDKTISRNGFGKNSGDRTSSKYFLTFFMLLGYLFYKN